MINCSVFALADLLTQLMAAEGEYRQRAVFADMARTNPALMEKAAALGAASIYTPNMDKENIKGLLQFALHIADKLGLEATHHRVDMFDARLGQQITFDDFAAEIRALREAIEGEIKHQYFYHYPKQKALLLLRFPGDWAEINSKFPSAGADGQAAIDCFALGHNTACVFHLMRVVEHGLRALAAAVNLTFDIQQWQNIIQQIESEIREIGNKWRASPSKIEWMSFYSEAAKEFFYFKDGWRNHVSHNRGVYDEPMARSVIDHVQTFMNHLSTRLSEENTLVGQSS